MKTKELRIGNYVQAEWDNKYTCEVYMITTVSVWLELKGNIEEGLSRYQEIPLDVLQPIKLTEEWIFNYGFKKLDAVGCYAKDVGIFSFDLYYHDGLYSLESTGTPMGYVHELQNLYFAVTGDEL